MRRTLALTAALATAAVLLTSGLAAGRGSEKVQVGDDYFAPKKVKVDKNTRIKFDWIGTDAHDVVKVSGPGPFFQSGPISGSGVQFKQKFKKPGKYKIICSLHEGMKMTVNVRKN